VSQAAGDSPACCLLPREVSLEAEMDRHFCPHLVLSWPEAEQETVTNWQTEVDLAEAMVGGHQGSPCRATRPFLKGNGSGTPIVRHSQTLVIITLIFKWYLLLFYLRQSLTM
jgi:hypothetical protein